VALPFPDSEYAGYLPDEAERLRDLDTALHILSYLTRDLDAPEGTPYRAASPPARPTEDDQCDWEHGVCACPGCGHIVLVVPRGRTRPCKVVDADGREHYCERTVAAALRRAGVAGLTPVLRKYAERPVILPIDADSGPTDRPPAANDTNGKMRWLPLFPERDHDA